MVSWKGKGRCLVFDTIPGAKFGRSGELVRGCCFLPFID